MKKTVSVILVVMLALSAAGSLAAIKEVKSGPSKVAPAKTPTPAESGSKEEKKVPEGLTDLRTIKANWIIDMRYASTNNSRGKVMYDTDDCYLRTGTAKKLAKAQQALDKLGYRIVILDAYRPQHVQQYMWDTCPEKDRKYLADPKKGSNHTRGNAVDITLADKNGKLCDMQSDYDDVTKKATRGYTKSATKLQRRHTEILTKAMIDAGFKSINIEWWHFSDSKSYALIKE